MVTPHAVMIIHTGVSCPLVYLSTNIDGKLAVHMFSNGITSCVSLCRSEHTRKIRKRLAHGTHGTSSMLMKLLLILTTSHPAQNGKAFPQQCLLCRLAPVFAGITASSPGALAVTGRDRNEKVAIKQAAAEEQKHEKEEAAQRDAKK